MCEDHKSAVDLRGHRAQTINVNTGNLYYYTLYIHNDIRKQSLCSCLHLPKRIWQ